LRKQSDVYIPKCPFQVRFRLSTTFSASYHNLNKLFVLELGKERETWKYLKTLLKVVTDIQKAESEEGINFSIFFVVFFTNSMLPIVIPSCITNFSSRRFAIIASKFK
jgi:hypothetical protein